MKYLITGGTGFLGSYIAKQLLARGDEVVCFSRSTPIENSMSDILTHEQIADLDYERGDVTDLIKLMHVCQDKKVEMIIHVAGMLQNACDENVPQAVNTNILGTLNCFEAARLLGIKRVVWASSNSAIGTASHLPDGYAKTDSLHNPITIYGKTKDFNEFVGAYYHTAYGLETIGLRYNVIYGKGRRRGGANYIKSMLNDPALGIPSIVENGDDEPNFIYVEDAARATLLAADMEYRRAAYNISGESVSMRKLRAYVLSILPSAQITLKPGVANLAWKFDTGIEREELGFVPEYSIEQGAFITINDVRAAAGLPLIEAPDEADL